MLEPVPTSALAGRWKTVSHPRIGFRERVAVEHVGLDQLGGRRRDELTAARGKVVVDDDLDAVRQQPVRESAADEAGAAGDERALHASSKPAVTASRWNICTVSSENCSRSLPSVSSFASRSCVR